MKIAAIVVNYRTPDLAVRCVTSVLAELAPLGSHRVVLVDNASGDNSVQVLRKAMEQSIWSERVELIEAPRNGGLSYGINLALHALLARADPPEHIWNINPDAVAEPGSGVALVAELERDASVGIVGSRVLAMDGTVVGGAFRALSMPAEMMRAGLTSPKRLLDAYAVHPDRMAGTCDVDWVPGCSFVFKRKVIEDIGYFDEGYFLYFEESDFCERARRVGWRIRYCAEGPVRHEGSASTGMNDLSRRMPKYWFESRRRYYRKHHGLLYANLCETAAAVGAGVSRVRSAVRSPTQAERPGMLLDSLRFALTSLSDWKALNPDQQAVTDTEREAAVDRATFVDLVVEDYETHGRDFSEAGFWALLTHRLATHASRTAAGQLLGVSTAQRALATMVDWVWGIHIPTTTRIGRRVRIWHNGCIVIEAREVGDDVQLRHNTTIGPARGHSAPRGLLPVIGARAEIGAGACILGPVSVGADAIVGANTVVLKDVAPSAHVLGVPARPIPV